MSSRKKLSALDATLFVMGGIIGVGIFFNPQAVAERAFEPWAFLFLWLFGGAIALCAAFTFAELGASFPRTGGWFVYLRESYGPFPAFLFAWIVLLVVSTGAVAAMSTFCADMLHVALPRFVGESGGGSHRAVAVLLILGVTAIALSGVKRAALMQNLCMVTKLVVLALLILGGLVLTTPGEGESLGAAIVTQAEGPEGRSLLAGMISGLKPVFFSYGGWQMIGYLAPEVERPERTVPRAIVIGVTGVIVVYLLANLAFLAVLGIDGLAADGGFAATTAGRAFGGTGRRLLAAGMAVSAFGVCMVTILGTPWLYVAMAREKLFFQRVGALHPTTGVPHLALQLQAVVALVYLFAGTLQYYVDAVVFVEWMFHFLVALALLRLRKHRPDVPRPYVSPLFPLAPVVYASAAAVVVLGTLWNDEPELKYTGLAIVAAGALVYKPWRRLLGAGGTA